MQSTFYKGALFVFLGAICFSTKGIFAKLAFGYGVDGLEILTLRMLFALPFYVLILVREYNPNRHQLKKMTASILLHLA